MKPDKRKLTGTKKKQAAGKQDKFLNSSFSIAKREKWISVFPIAITAVFFILSLIGILHHEMWRDEYQAWMCADEAHSISQLIQNIKYEGHPALWHLILYVITALTQNLFWMQFVHIIISAAFIFLFNRYSPFPLLHKFLFSFGYFAFFEYNLISRSYALGVLLLVIFCILYKNRRKNILWISAVLVLFSNLSVFGVMFTICFTGILLIENIFLPQKENNATVGLPRLSLFLVLTLIGASIGYLQIRPEPDNTFQTIFFTEFEWKHFIRMTSKLIETYFSFPDITSIHFWNHNMFVRDTSSYALVATPLLFLFWLIAFMRHRIVAILYILGSGALFTFYYYTGLMYSRYAGHLFLLLIICNWLLTYMDEKEFKNKLMNKISLVGRRFRNPVLITILAVHFFGGIAAYCMDIKYPFSTSSRAVSFLKDNNLKNYEWFGSKDFVLSPIVAQMDRKILYGEIHEYGSFIIYDLKRVNVEEFAVIEPYIEEMFDNGIKHVLLIFSKEIFVTYNHATEPEPWMEAPLTKNLRMKRVAYIEPGIVEDEKYYMYTIEQVN